MDGDFRVGSWLVCPRLNTVQSNGRVVRIEHKMMQVLVCLAGRPGELEAALKAAGVDTFIFAGGDALAILKDVYRRMERP